MAFLQADVAYVQISLAAGTAKTVVGVKAAAQQAIKILEASISFDGSTSTAAPAVCDFSQVNFGVNAPATSSTTVPPMKRDSGRAETVQTAGANGWTAEPTTYGSGSAPSGKPTRTIDVPVFGGVYHYINPFASPIIVPGGLGFAIRSNAVATVNCSGHICFEE